MLKLEDWIEDEESSLNFISDYSKYIKICEIRSPILEFSYSWFLIPDMWERGELVAMWKDGSQRDIMFIRI